MSKGKKIVLIVIVAIILAMILFYFVIWPLIQKRLANKYCEYNYGEGYKYVYIYELSDETLKKNNFNLSGKQASGIFYYCYNEKEDKIGGRD